MAALTVGDRAIGRDEPVFVIAEAGSNHNGNLGLAKELVDVASDAGADAVKFQTFRADRLYVEDSGRVEYLDDDRPIYEIIEEMEMPYEWIPELHDHCRERGIYFMSTPFDEASADELADFVPAWKVASYTSSHHPFLRYLAGTGMPVVMSTGAHDLAEVAESVDVLDDAGVTGLILLQCVAAYPTPLEDSNVRVVETLRREFGVPVGLSDHTIEPTAAPSAAAALGAVVIEKHFTLDKEMEGPDHKFALEPDELEAMVRAVRETERALGDGTKRVLEIEEELHQVARRAIHAAHDIEAEAAIGEDDIAVLRPGTRTRGLDPNFLDEVVGAIAKRDIEKGEGITWDNVGR